MPESRGEAEHSIVDLILIEGFKTHSHPKLEIRRESEGKPLLCSEDPEIGAMATDRELPCLKIPKWI